MKSATIPTPLEKTARSPKRSTNFPEISPEENRATAKAETINPTAALLTPKERAKTGIAGRTIPKPNATKNDAKINIFTSRRNWAKGEVNLDWINRLPHQLLPHELLHNPYLYAMELRAALVPVRNQ